MSVNDLEAGPPLTPSGLLNLDLYGEVELITCNVIEIRFLQGEEQQQEISSTVSNELQLIYENSNLVCTVTTHRIILQNGPNKRYSPLSKQIHLQHVSNAECTGAPTFFHPRTKYKITLYLVNSPNSIQLVFPLDSEEKRNDVQKHIAKSLSRKEWNEQLRIKRMDEQAQLERKIDRKVGINAILAQNEKRHNKAKQVASTAFDDIDIFMRDAAELVKVIDKCVATIENSQRDSSSDLSSSSEEEKKLTSMLQEMGMTSALSKEKLGANLYYERLARQIADFLCYNKYFKEIGGIMTLTDFYCVFNRARATNFISPDDLLISLDRASRLNLGIYKKNLGNNVLVIASSDYNEDKLQEKLLKLSQEGVTPLEVSQAYNISVILANVHLVNAEKKGILCRDVTLEGVRFYPNRFN